MQKPVYAVHKDAAGTEVKVLKGFELVQPGSMSPPEYKEATADLTNFLAYVGEPIKLERQRIGIWVLLFLALATVVFLSLIHI